VSDPFRTLGVRPDASMEEIRSAWRTAMKRAHPDMGGSTKLVDELRTALEEATSAIGSRRGGKARESEGPRSGRVARDVPSFTIGALPAEAHEALLVAVGTAMSLHGDVVDSDPPYLVEFLSRAGSDGLGDLWCRCELVPDAGSTSVFLTVGSDAGGSAPASMLDALERVRGTLVDALNALDWTAISGP
jgi:hypothetical protein